MDFHKNKLLNLQKLKFNIYMGDLISLQSIMYKHALFLCKNNIEDAKDLVQETNYFALKYKDMYKTGNYRAWVLTIMNNIYINQGKRKFAPTSRFELAEVQSTTIELKTLLSQIPSQLTEIVSLRASGYKYREIAEALHMPIGSVKSKLKRARECIKALIA